MAGKAGKLQSAFTAGELDPLTHERTELKYYSTGASRLENAEIAPQGGFRNRDGLRDIGQVDDECRRLFGFNASDGDSFDIVVRAGWFEVWDATSQVDVVNMTLLSDAMVPEVTIAQQLDTMLVFHRDLETQRIKHFVADATWGVDLAPFQNVPNWDYGGDINGAAYTNGIAAKWQIEFTGLADDTTTFELTIAGEVTTALLYDATLSNTATLIKAAIEALPNVAPGITVASPGANKLDITFAGAGNEGDSWAVSARVINKSDAAITSSKLIAGADPGEPVFSVDRGFPQCGCFFQQRLLIGGFRSLGNAWAFSGQADYYNFDVKLLGATGAALIPMDTPGGETIEHMIDNRYPLIFTNKSEIWLASRALTTDEPPNHVTASSKGVQRGTPIVLNEGAAIYTQPGGNVLAEFRYTDVEGNFASLDVSLLASHLERAVIDQAQRPAKLSTDGNHLVQVKADGSANLAVFIRDQEITAFTRLTSGAGLFKAVSRNGRNEISFIVQRPDSRRLERFEEGLLLDEAVRVVNDPPAATLSGLARFNGREIWAIADGDVFGPFTPTDGTIILPRAVAAADVGSWAPPVFTSLPPDRTVGPQVVNKRRARIHGVTLSVLDTTSLAISTNGRPLQDVDLYRWGMAADVPELEAGVTGEITVSGLTGWADAPVLTVSQLRPGRLNVRSVTIHARL